MILEKVKAIFEKLKGYFTGIFNYEGDFSQSTFGTQTKKVQESKSQRVYDSLTKSPKSILRKGTPIVDNTC